MWEVTPRVGVPAWCKEPNTKPADLEFVQQKELHMKLRITLVASTLVAGKLQLGAEAGKQGN